MSRRTLASRIQYAGGSQLSRINKNKLWSLKQALKNDYQTHIIRTDSQEAWPCLINKNNLKPDYDKEYISVEFGSGLQAGDTFEDLGDGSHWMIYLPIVTETAYLRSEIIRCRYSLDINGKTYWIYFQGPTETDIRWNLKKNKTMNSLNLSGTIYIKLDDNTVNFFNRFTHIQIAGHTWEIQVTDSISVPGILELEIQEYFDSLSEDLPSIEVTDQNGIVGPIEVKQDVEVGYMLSNNNNEDWTITGNPRVQIIKVSEDKKYCTVKVHQGAIGSYTLKCGNESLTANIDWHKSIICGPTTVYPYDKHIYHIDAKEGITVVQFTTDNPEIATCKQNEDLSCEVFIKTSRAGEFKVLATYGNNETAELPVRVESL